MKLPSMLIAVAMVAIAAFPSCSSSNQSGGGCKTDADCPGTETCDVTLGLCRPGSTGTASSGSGTTSGIGTTSGTGMGGASGTGGAGGSSCTGPNCTCSPPQVTCPSGCADLDTDAKNCGSCENACPAMNVCVAQMCVFQGGGGAGGAGDCVTTPGCNHCEEAFMATTSQKPTEVCCGMSATLYYAAFDCLCEGACKAACGAPGGFCSTGKLSSECLTCAMEPQGQGCGAQILGCISDK